MCLNSSKHNGVPINVSSKCCCNAGISIIKMIINMHLLLDILKRPFEGWQLSLITEEDLVTSVSIKCSCARVGSPFMCACATYIRLY